MSSNAARRHRGLTAVLAVLAVLATAGGCGNVDLSRANFQRTTVPAEPGGGGQGRVPTGPITDPAVTLDALRTVDPCALVGGEALSALGKAGQTRPDGWNGCAVEVSDPGGKTVEVRLSVGEAPIGGAGGAIGNVEGLPLLENKDGDASCYTTALTSREPALGIVLDIDYVGGDPCRAGRTALTGIVRALRAQPAQLPREPGSLVGIDPCTAVDPAVLAEVAGEGTSARLTGPHGCAWRGDGPPTIQVDFRFGFFAGEGKQPVDLGNGVTGAQEMVLKDTSKCSVSWPHRPVGEEGEGELVDVYYTHHEADPAVDDPCGKATTVAKHLVSTLPRP